MPWEIDPIVAARAFWTVDLYRRVARHESGLTVYFQHYLGGQLPPLSLKAEVQGGHTWLCQATALPDGFLPDEIWDLLRQAAYAFLQERAAAGWLP